MASFAKLGLNGKVIQVQSVNNEVLHDANGVEQENIGIDFLTQLTGWAIWKQTSYNTRSGTHKNGGTPFRKNFAGRGYIYDADKDAFIAPKPFDSWTFNETTFQWDPPVPYPENASFHEWNEETKQWDSISDT